jgi:N-acetylglucosaminyldiphosphoundecaprenol N-acetyl-beta-D-mannosaminyltransferase
MSQASQFYRMIGVRVQALTMSGLNALVEEAVKSGHRRIIANHNLHSVYVVHREVRMRAFFERAHTIHVDGMPLIWIGKLLGYPFRREHRVTYADWIDSLMAEASRHEWRVFYVGSKPGVADRGAAILRSRFPQLQIETAHGYFDARPDSAENQAVLARIETCQPNLLLVGMGMPRQEHWVLDNIDRLHANAVLTVGAAIDYVAGAIPTPPRWAGRLGAEWLFRLIVEPRRLTRRYLIEPWFVLRLLLRDIVEHPTRQRASP